MVSRRLGARSCTPNYDAVRIRANVANHRVQQATRFPTRRRSSPADQIIHPAEASRIYRPRLLLRKSSSAISGFRSRCGREQHSDCAQMDLRFGTFQSGGFVLDSTRFHLRGQRPWTDICTWNVVSPGGYSKWFFCVPIGLYRGNLRPPTARRMPARSALGGPGDVKPEAVIKASIWSAWSCPASTTSTAPGARTQAACAIRTR
jgi:hypothetical protein